MSILVFLFGAALGSFINVVAVRYDPERPLLSARSLGGRSRCPRCSKMLRWFELLPIVSFIFQRGRCRRCGSRISFQYPFVEIIAGLICVFVPLRLAGVHIPHSTFHILISSFWAAVFLTLLLIVLVDKRLYIIPDEANIFLGVLGILITTLAASQIATSSFLAPYASLFGLFTNVWLSHLVAACIAGALFAFIIWVTRGKGMGMGDLKLIIPLGLIFGWPDIIFLAALSFIIGAVFGVLAIIAGQKNLKSAVPFGPFLALAALIVFFWGADVVGLYVRMLGI